MTPLTVMTRPRTQEFLVIEGGVPLTGTIRPEGNKNAALTLLAATLLTAEPVVLGNMPRIRDVETMLELLADLGAEVEWTARNEVRICAADVHSTSLDEALSERIRASILLAGPLLARFGSADVPLPGGDVIGRRRVDSHLLALEALGAEVTADRTYRFRAPGGLKGTEFHLDEASVTATENALMAAALAEGLTTIHHAACEPHVQDLCRLLVAMGVEIDGVGSNLLRVHGQASLGGASHVCCPDHIEVGSFIGMAAVTGGDVTITGCEPNDLRATLLAFAPPRRPRRDRRARRARAAAIRSCTIVDDAHDQIAKIDDGPWPAFPADMTSVAVAVATQAPRHRPDLREDVREPPGVHGQARQHGRAHHPLRPAPRGHHRPGEALRPAPLEPGHPRRHRAPDRLAVRRGHERDRRRRADRPRLRAHRRAPARARRAHRARLRMTLAPVG